jgi:hypothetical protein
MTNRRKVHQAVNTADQFNHQNPTFKEVANITQAM